MKNLLLSATILAASTTGTLATDLTILNAGSKTGSFAMQSTAYAQDLGSAYNVTLDIHGDYCVAAARTTTTTVLLPLVLLRLLTSVIMHFLTILSVLGKFHTIKVL